MVGEIILKNTSCIELRIIMKILDDYEINVIDFLSFKPKEIVESPGVYFLIYSNLNPQRFGGKDKDGILYIGKSNNLKRRISSLRRGILNRNNEYHSVSENYRKLFDKDTYIQLRIGLILSTKNDFSKLESEFLELYFNKYKDLPVLNFKKSTKKYLL